MKLMHVRTASDFSAGGSKFSDYTLEGSRVIRTDIPLMTDANIKTYISTNETLTK